MNVAAMHETLHDATSRDEAFDVIRFLIDEIRLVPVDGELRIQIKGELAGILELCEAGANQKPGGLSTSGLAQQIKMVAGERNQRYLQGLFSRIPTVDRSHTAVIGARIT